MIPFQPFAGRFFCLFVFFLSFNHEFAISSKCLCYYFFVLLLFCTIIITPLHSLGCNSPHVVIASKAGPFLSFFFLRFFFFTFLLYVDFGGGTSAIRQAFLLFQGSNTSSRAGTTCNCNLTNEVTTSRSLEFVHTLYFVLRYYACNFETAKAC